MEKTQNDAYETTEVAVSEAGSGSWTTVWSKTSLDTSENAWTASGSISLAAYAGKSIQLRFRFDSSDEIENDFVGWLVDDIGVSNLECANPPAPAAVFDDDFEGGNWNTWSSVSQ